LPHLATIDTSSIQFESDEVMRRSWGDDGAIACCVSPMLVGKQMQLWRGAPTLQSACCMRSMAAGTKSQVSRWPFRVFCDGSLSFSRKPLDLSNKVLEAARELIFCSDEARRVLRSGWRPTSRCCAPSPIAACAASGQPSHQHPSPALALSPRQWTECCTD
jgi:Pyruvate formate lyase-like